MDIIHPWSRRSQEIDQFMSETAPVNQHPIGTHYKRRVRCLFAIELSKQSWVIGFNTPLSEKISPTLKGCDWEGLHELIEEMRARDGRETGRAK
jgi:hypothetical protein